MSDCPKIQLNSGYKIPQVGLGTWQGSVGNLADSKKGLIESAVECAIKCGYRHIDCAWMYENETEVGKAVKTMIKENVIKREDVFITSKLWNTYHKPELVRPAVKLALKKLQMEYIDLFLLHLPTGLQYIDDNTIIPIGEQGVLLDNDTDYVTTWKAMEELQKEGLVRSIGVSNLNEFQLNRVIKEGSILPAVNQIEVHPNFTQNNLVSFCQDRKIAITAYSCLGSAQRPWAQSNEPVLLEEPQLLEIASKLNRTPAQVVLRYLIQRDITVIPKSVTPERIRANIQVFDFKLTEEEMKVIGGINKNFRAIPFSPFAEHKYYPFKENYSE